MVVKIKHYNATELHTLLWCDIIMEVNKYNEVKKIVIDYITEVSFKSLLEGNDVIADLYDNNEMTHEDFCKIVEEIKSDALKRCS